MIPTTFGNSPELLLQVLAMQNAEDIARAQRASFARTQRAKKQGHGRWVGAIRSWTRRSQHASRSEKTSQRMA
ncbi:hypothetical protein GCM10027053_44620 [Intrasporangium mesophilum]